MSSVAGRGQKNQFIQSPSVTHFVLYMWMIMKSISVTEHYVVYYRSLVALSLILAMLLFKPAPIYILDEVDAALDLSHTQNIGQMLRTHFRHSQVV